MKIVIDIPEERYKDIQRIAWVQLEYHHFKTAEQIITNGTPLPKGHGALKDADAIRKTISESIEECQKWADEVKGGEMYARVSQSLGTFVECSLRIKNAPTIIEADKEESEVQD